jgi:hypothetical protein
MRLFVTAFPNCITAPGLLTACRAAGVGMISTPTRPAAAALVGGAGEQLGAVMHSTFTLSDQFDLMVLPRHDKMSALADLPYSGLMEPPDGSVAAEIATAQAQHITARPDGFHCGLVLFTAQWSADQVAAHADALLQWGPAVWYDGGCSQPLLQLSPDAHVTLPEFGFAEVGEMGPRGMGQGCNDQWGGGVRLAVCDACMAGCSCQL